MTTRPDRVAPSSNLLEKASGGLMPFRGVLNLGSSPESGSGRGRSTMMASAGFGGITDAERERIEARVASIEFPPKGDTPAKRRWRMLRGTIKVVGVFEQISYEHKLYGSAVNDDHIQWNNIDKLEYPDKPWYIILPDNPFRVYWDVMMCFILFTIAFYVPHRVSFVENSMLDCDGTPNRGNGCGGEFGIWWWYEEISFWVFTADIVLNFFAAFELETQETPARCEIDHSVIIWS